MECVCDVVLMNCDVFEVFLLKDFEYFFLLLKILGVFIVLSKEMNFFLVFVCMKMVFGDFIVGWFDDEMICCWMGLVVKNCVVCKDFV